MRSKIYGSADIPERLKEKVYAGSVLAVLLYSCKSWCLAVRKTGAWRCKSWCLSSSSSGGTHALHTHAAPHAALGRHVKDGHVKDAAQGVVGGMFGAAEDGSVEMFSVIHRRLSAAEPTPSTRMPLPTLPLGT